MPLGATQRAVLRTPSTNIIDSFERGNVDPYFGDTGAASVVDESNLSFSAKDGSKVLDLDGSGEVLIASTADLPNYLSKGEQARWWQRSDESSDYSGFAFRCASTASTTDDHIHAGLDIADNNLRLRDFYNGNNLGTTFDGNFALDTWFQPQISIGNGTKDFGGNVGQLNDNQLDFRVFNEDGTQNDASPLQGTTSAGEAEIGVGWHNDTAEGTWYDGGKRTAQ